jgi:peptide/nickel transport system substrate-binding protein
MKQKRMIPFLTLLLLIFMTACGGKQAPSPTQSTISSTADTSADTKAAQTETTAQKTAFVLPYYPSASLHPITSNNRVNLTLAPLVYEGLFQLNDKFQPEQLLCESDTVSSDQLQWTFTLRSNVCFSDGSNMTAADVVTSLNEARSSSQYGGRFSDVSSISASGNSVVVTLKQPNSNLPALLDIPVIREQGGGIPLGTGPYQFSGTSDTLSLTKNPHAWKTITLFQSTIALYAVSSASDLISAFNSGSVSFISSDLTGVNALGFSTGYDIWDYHTTNMLYVGFNCDKGVCSNSAVRKALSRGLDRTTVTTSLLAGHGVESVLPFSPETDFYSKDLATQYAYSPQDMISGLTAVGYQSGQDGRPYLGKKAMTLTMIVNTDNSYKLSVAEYLKQQLEGFGITVDLQELSYDDYAAALKSKAFDLYLGEVKLTADFNISTLIAPGGAINYGGYYSSDAVSLLSTFLSSPEGERAAAAYALSKTLAEDAPFAVLCFKTNSVMAHWGMVTGVSATRQNVFYGLENWKLQ